ncbi:MAG: transposase [Nibricoccus sp.]
MPRKLRLESEGGVYHVINRGNYRGDIFRSEKAKAAFLKCLGEACEKCGWVVHAWCVMSNHYHIALETPRGNLADGMQWLQGTFSRRFNSLRRENGHLFQGRYKSLTVEPAGLGALCHYIHLNPVRAKICTLEKLGQWPWTSLHWLLQPKLRAKWFTPRAALEHAGELADMVAGRRNYLKYLAWLSEDEPAQKALNFAAMSKGWAIGSIDFKKSLVLEHDEAITAIQQNQTEWQELKHAMLDDTLTRLLKKLKKQRGDLLREGKSVPWKLALAAAMKARTVATNRWLGEHLHMGNMHEVSRKVSAWAKAPDVALTRKFQ